MGPIRAFVPLMCLLASLFVTVPGDSQTFRSVEKPVKAAFVCQFPSFLHWEKREPPEEGAPIRLGILGDDPFEGELEKAVRAHLAKGRQFELMHSKDPAALAACHVVCIGMELGEAFDDALARFHEAGVATICDRPGAAKRGALINFVLIQDRVGFEINMDTSNRAGIKISSQLLKLAVIVRSDEVQEGEDSQP